MKTTELINKVEQLGCRVDIKRHWMDFYFDTDDLNNWQCMRIHYDRTHFSELHLPKKAENLRDSDFIKSLNQLFKTYIETPMDQRGDKPKRKFGARYYLNADDLATLAKLSQAIGDSPATDELKAVQSVINKLQKQTPSLIKLKQKEQD